MTPAQRLIARIDEVLRTTTKFRDAQEWALAAGLSRGYLSTLRSRAGTLEIRDVKAEKLAALAKAAGMTVAELMGDVTLPSPDGSPTLERAIEEYRWPPALAADPDRAAAVLVQVREDAARIAPMPVSFWTARLDLLCSDTEESSKLRRKAK